MTEATRHRSGHASRQIAEADEFRQQGKLEHAIERYEQAASAEEVPSAELCVRLAQCYEQLECYQDACRWAVAVADHPNDFKSWHTATGVLSRGSAHDGLGDLRTSRAAVLGSFNTTQLAQMLPLAAARTGFRLDVYESPYGQYRQEILDANSAAYAFFPNFLILAVHEGGLTLPHLSASPESDIEAELRRWTALWDAAREYSQARVVQYNFATPAEVPLGHLAVRVPGSRFMMTQQLNARLGQHAGNDVSIVDCDRLSAWIGKQRWFDARYWNFAKQAVALTAIPLLARHTAAVLGADLGLARKCLVLDLDNTLWGGVIGEDGLSGIRLGGGVDGEAFTAFQEYLLRLKEKGIILAVCSKNNEAEAKLPFQQHPDMRITLDDIALFVANWEPKPDNLRRIAQTLGIGVDSLVLLDDNPIERAAVRRSVPEVAVVPLPTDPSRYVELLSQFLGFETPSLTQEDRQRTQQYRVHARVAEAKCSTSSIEEFYHSLEMQAVVGPFDDLHLPRIAQLIGKTNQFNLTTRRHSLGDLRKMIEDPTCVHLSLRLRDRFAEHGLVSVVIAFLKGDVLDIDTWLMSCRVMGRTVEATMFEQLCQLGLAHQCVTIRGSYIPTAKNEPAKDVFSKFGFSRAAESNGTETWLYDLQENPLIQTEFIKVVSTWNAVDEHSPATRRAVS